jgi:hypothetical protein
MARFETTTLARRVVADIARALRDAPQELAPLLTDISRIETVERHALPDGAVHVVNVWHASAKLPALLASFVSLDALAWTDRAEWSPDGTRCSFRIEPHFLKGSIHCEGSTLLEPAMRDRGTRIRFAGELTLDSLPGASVLGRGPVEAVERLVAELIAGNLAKLGRALSGGEPEGPR